MRRSSKFLPLVIVGLLFISASANAAVKPGDQCKKVGMTSTAKNLKFTCIKSGKKLVWSKGVQVKKSSPTPVATPAPTPTPTATPKPTPVVTPTPTAEPIVLPTSFENLYENRKGISLAAWQKSAETIKASKNKSGILEIFTGPNTKPFFDDYPAPVSIVSRLFPARGEPARNIVI